jgi:hypothetical protein
MAKKITAKQRSLWEAVNAFIRHNGGWTVSQPHSWPIQMQCAFACELPAKLAVLGYDVASTGSITRVTHDGPCPVEAFSIDAPRYAAGPCAGNR